MKLFMHYCNGAKSSKKTNLSLAARLAMMPASRLQCRRRRRKRRQEVMLTGGVCSQLSPSSLLLLLLLLLPSLSAGNRMSRLPRARRQKQPFPVPFCLRSPFFLCIYLSSLAGSSHPEKRLVAPAR